MDCSQKATANFVLQQVKTSPLVHCFFLAAKRVGKILEDALGVKRVALVMEGMGVNHAHIKLYPLWGLANEFAEVWAKDKIYFDKYEGYISTQLGPEADMGELKELAKKIEQTI